MHGANKMKFHIRKDFLALIDSKQPKGNKFSVSL